VRENDRSVFQGFDLLPLSEMNSAEVICQRGFLRLFLLWPLVLFPRESVRSRTRPSANEQT
jgi:hypothetical protein